jgi:hypothetical protein
VVPTMTEYTVELFKEGGEGSGIEAELAREVQLDTARRVYRVMCEMYPGRLVMLSARARVLARSDRPRQGISGSSI